MNKNKRGNVTLMILPIGFLLLIVVITTILILYIQIRIQLYDVKTSLFYIVSSSIGEEDMENLAYKNYCINTEMLTHKVDKLLKENYLKSNTEKGVQNIKCNNIELIESSEQSIQHTKGLYDVPILCVYVEIRFTPIIGILGDKIDILLHDDIKFNLLEFES